MSAHHMYVGIGVRTFGGTSEETMIADCASGVVMLLSVRR